MSNRHHQTPEPNNGTYQTGFTDRPKGSSGLIAVLLALTIFLGGLASALGLLNVRLLQQLMEQPEETVPVNVYTSPSSSVASSGETPDSDDAPVPELPEQRDIRLELYPHTARFESYGSMTAQQIYSNSASSLAGVRCDGELSGIGVILSADGYILTNAHTVESASRIYVSLADGSSCRAALVGLDVLTDLAVLYIEGQDLTAAQFCDSAELTDGDPIASAAALPEQDYETLTEGFVSDRLPVSLGEHSLELLQTTAGSCEGPVFNYCGQIIGMNSGAVSTYFGLYIQSETGFVVPSTTVKEVVDQLIAFGFVPGRPTLGIRTEAISKVYQKYWDLPGGLQLLSVSTQAQAQGLQQGDILLALNGQRLTKNADLHKLLLSQTAGQSLTAVVFRDGQSLTLSLTIFDLAA